MAQTRKTTTKSTRSSSTRAKTSSNVRKNSAPVQVNTTPDNDFWQKFSKTRVFAPIMTILVSAIIIGLDLLIAWNNYGRFFKLVGVEVLVIFALWVVRILVSLSADNSGKA